MDIKTVSLVTKEIKKACRTKIFRMAIIYRLVFLFLTLVSLGLSSAIKLCKQETEERLRKEKTQGIFEIV
jgi:hypothetical protein